MRVEVTKDVANHQVNDNYPCLLIHFDQTDKHFFWYKRNWMPRDDELFKIFKILYKISPSFRRKVQGWLVDEI